MAGADVQLVECGHHVLHARVWNRSARRAVILWHGVTGTSLDHVPLAERLASAGYRVIAPDSLGCGLSDWATDRERGYGLGPLAKLARAFVEAMAEGPVDWVGTSKGGGLGIRLAAEAPDLVRSLTLNDVGATLPVEFSGALADRLGSPPRFSDLTAFRDHVSRFLSRSGITPTHSKLDQITIGWSRHMEDGSIGYHYDPAVSNQFRHNTEDFALWPYWDAVHCPVLILRGSLSHVLSAEETAEMLARNVRAQAHVFPDQGHVNFLDDPEQQQKIVDFISE